jgi:hypothetical protein
MLLAVVRWVELRLRRTEVIGAAPARPSKEGFSG